jgi:hypothetical protein
MYSVQPNLKGEFYDGKISCDIAKTKLAAEITKMAVNWSQKPRELHH